MSNVRRVRPPAVVPLELWDVLVGDDPLYLIRDVDQAAAIATVVLSLQRGDAVRLRGRTSLPAVSFGEVVVAGGGAVDDVVVNLQGMGLVARAAKDPTWIGGAGGRALVAAGGFVEADALIVDVGQTSIKRFYNGRIIRLTRDTAVIPMELDVRAANARARARAATVAFIADALTMGRPPSVVVLALPCEIGDDLAVAGCSYPWNDGDPDLVADAIAAARLPSTTPVLVLNDAELATVAVDVDRTPSTATLVLTIGLGLGAAWLAATGADSR